LPRLPTVVIHLVLRVVGAGWCAAVALGQETPPPVPPTAPPVTPPATAVEPGAEAAGDQPRVDEPKPTPRAGIPVEDLLVHTHCARCHALDDRQHMTRISYVRKSPEGWSESVKRMVRLHGVQLSPADAKQIVRSLADSHGLARSEAERGLYESERRVHWSEEAHDQDFRRACAECHPLGRVLLQQRDEEEWQLLRATHVAMFPLARGQMGGGPPEDERRGGNRGGPGGASTTGSATGSASSSATGASPGGAATGGRRGGGDGPGQGGPSQGVGDRVLTKLAKDQPLFTPAWERWTRNRREVPLADTWLVTAADAVRGDLVGTATVRRVDSDEYEVAWRLTGDDGTTLERTGKGLLYAGYSWRGRSQDPDGTTWREVLLLDDTWQTLRGRLFTGAYDEVGVDVTLHRQQQRPRVLALGNVAVPVPVAGHRLEVHGEGFPPECTPTDFFVGRGVSITSVERRSANHVVLTIDAAAGTELGARTVAYGSEPGTAALQLYDTVDYVRIAPRQGLARIGGAKHPKQVERFAAWAVHRGADGKPYTDDDVDLFRVRPRWSLAEFRVRENDDDLTYVGAIDAVTGVFTPAIDGPNPARRWQANNVGDVFVTAELELDVAVRPEPPPAPAAGSKDAPKPTTTAATEPPRRERRLFRARSHLLVTVPLYARWQALDWEDR
jgi:quinohemoprotein amine dehydrogenase